MQHNIAKRVLVGMVALVILVSPFFVLAPLALAQGADFGLSNAAKNADLPGSQAVMNDPQLAVQTAIGRLIGSALTFVGVIFLILVIYGGVMWMTSGGNEEKAGKAKKLIGAAVIGMVIIFGAYVITSFVFDTVRTATSPAPS